VVRMERMPNLSSCVQPVPGNERKTIGYDDNDAVVRQRACRLKLQTSMTTRVLLRA
jgi:hypothetical protein